MSAENVASMPDNEVVPALLEQPGTWPNLCERSDTMESKRCPRCCEAKPLVEFNTKKTGKPDPYCRPCRNAISAEWRAANPDKAKAAQRRYRVNNPQYARRDFYARHGLTQARFNELFEAQGRRCAICQAPEPGGNGWHIDHDHACCAGPQWRKRCGRCVRQILCNGCNLGIGHLGDDPERLRAAADYIERHRAATA